MVRSPSGVTRISERAVGAPPVDGLVSNATPAARAQRSTASSKGFTVVATTTSSTFRDRRTRSTSRSSAGDWNSPLLLIGALFLVGAVGWALIDPSRKVFDEPQGEAP